MGSQPDILTQNMAYKTQYMKDSCHLTTNVRISHKSTAASSQNHAVNLHFLLCVWYSNSL